MTAPHLVFTLYAAHGAWGSATLSSANTAWRATELTPGLSHVTGLLGAALGWRRERLGELAEGLHYAVLEVVTPRHDAVPDYHTVTPPAPPRRDEERGWTRWEELRPAMSGAGSGSALSWREYWTHGLWLVVLRAREGGQPGLDALEAALRRPCHPMFAGRKGCPLGLLPDPEIVLAPGPAEAAWIYGRSYLRRRLWLQWGADRVPEGRTRRLRAHPAVLFADQDFPGRPRHRRLLQRRDRPLAGTWRAFGMRGVAECAPGDGAT